MVYFPIYMIGDKYKSKTKGIESNFSGPITQLTDIIKRDVFKYHNRYNILYRILLTFKSYSVLHIFMYMFFKECIICN